MTLSVYSVLIALFSASSDWAGSNTCLTCHRDQHRSWQKTYHSTMTQWASRESVQGDFSGQTLTYFGESVRLESSDDGYFMSYISSDGSVSKSLPVVRTTGSHRYQQYFTQDDAAGVGNYWRLPLLWLTAEQRWTHMNAVFLGTDAQDFNAHLNLWNQNCIFCHTTGPVPGETNLDELSRRVAMGERIDYRYEPRYESRQADLGIACESCHGPGAEHARLNRNPLRRYRLHHGDEPDPSIVNPARLDAERSSSLCGQCHAQRVPLQTQDIRQWLKSGPTFRAGDKLSDHVQPIHAGMSQFELRFWPDGVPRLSAYEFQGMTESACYLSDELSCISCHSGHEGRPEGMITETGLSNTACAGCHESIGENVSEHSGHSEDSPGSLCYNCHMPRMVYGVMTLHRSHKIEIPEPMEAVFMERPDACSNCHVDHSAEWAADAIAASYAPDISDARGSRLINDYLAGDVVQRAVALYHLGRFDNGDTVKERAFVIPFLLHALDDNYPMIRWLARQSLLSFSDRDRELSASLRLDVLQDYDYIDDSDTHSQTVRILVQNWLSLNKTNLNLLPASRYVSADGRLKPSEVAARLALRSSKELEIGE